MSLRVLEDTPNIRLVLGGDGKGRIAFDRELGVLLASERLRWLRRSTRIAIADLDRIRIIVKRGTSLELELAIRYRSGRGLVEVARPVTVRDVNLDHEAVDLAFRIAVICRFDGYLVRSAEQAHTIELVTQAPDDSSPYRMPFPALRRIEELAGTEVQAVPGIHAPARYAGDHPRFTEPEPAVAPPVESTIAGIHVARWQPPSVEIVAMPTTSWFEAIADAFRNAVHSLGIAVLTAAFGVSFTGCLGLLLMEEAGFYSWKDYAAYAVAWALLALSLGLVLCCAAAMIEAFRDAFRALRRTRDQRSVRRLAIEGDKVVITIAGNPRELRRQDVRGVRLRHFAASRQWCEISVMLEDDDLLVAVTTLMADDSKHAALASLAIGLARQLDVPCRIELPVGPNAAGQSPGA